MLNRSINLVVSILFRTIDKSIHIQTSFFSFVFFKALFSSIFCIFRISYLFSSMGVIDVICWIINQNSIFIDLECRGGSRSISGVWPPRISRKQGASYIIRLLIYSSSVKCSSFDDVAFYNIVGWSSKSTNVNFLRKFLSLFYHW